MSDTFDRDAAREVLRDGFWRREATMDEIDVALDALEACVRPAPPQGIDRDALSALLGELRAEEVLHSLLWTDQQWAARVLALVRPVDGVVVLTREEAEIARSWFDCVPGHTAREENALAERLETAS